MSSQLQILILEKDFESRKHLKLKIFYKLKRLLIEVKATWYGHKLELKVIHLRIPKQLQPAKTLSKLTEQF